MLKSVAARLFCGLVVYDGYFCSSKVYNQIAQIPEGTARRDAIRLTKKKAKSLPRVTAYATAG